MTKLFTVEQLSALIHKSPSSIRSDVARNPSSLPPSLVIPGTRRRLFKDVDLWIESLINIQSPEITVPIRARRGRPTKSAQMQRQGTCIPTVSTLGGRSCQ